MIGPESIFEAATSEAAFAGLARLLSEAVDARSGVVHWRKAGAPNVAEISYSGYFSVSDMALYDKLPKGSDLWAAAINAPGARNQVWNISEKVGPSVYDRSVIYNEWIRQLGDDTFHCLGGTFQSDDIVVEVGFHRGRSQPTFEAAEVRRLQTLSRSIVQVMKVRQSVSAERRSSAMLKSSLDSLGLAIFRLSAEGIILHCNCGAGQLLARGDGLVEKHGRLTARQPDDRDRLASAIAGAGRNQGTTALFIQRADGTKYLLSLMAAWSESEQTILLTVEDPDHLDASIEHRLQELYGLTGAEAFIAASIARGATPDTIASARGTSVETVRGQIKALSAKMRCKRQSEIVSAVRSLPSLSK